MDLVRSADQALVDAQQRIDTEVLSRLPADVLPQIQHCQFDQTALFAPLFRRRRIPQSRRHRVHHEIHPGPEGPGQRRVPAAVAVPGSVGAQHHPTLLAAGHDRVAEPDRPGRRPRSPVPQRAGRQPQTPGPDQDRSRTRRPARCGAPTRTTSRSAAAATNQAHPATSSTPPKPNTAPPSRMPGTRSTRTSRAAPVTAPPPGSARSPHRRRPRRSRPPPTPPS